jgi:hypothetical protein
MSLGGDGSRVGSTGSSRLGVLSLGHSPTHPGTRGGVSRETIPPGDAHSLAPHFIPGSAILTKVTTGITRLAGACRHATGAQLRAGDADTTLDSVPVPAALDYRPGDSFEPQSGAYPCYGPCWHRTSCRFGQRGNSNQRNNGAFIPFARKVSIECGVGQGWVGPKEGRRPPGKGQHRRCPRRQATLPNSGMHLAAQSAGRPSAGGPAI